MGISRASSHKRRATSGKRHPHRKKRKYEMGRPPAMTRMGPNRIHPVRVRGGNIKYRALRLESGNYSWGSEATTRKARILAVVYNASNNELVRTNTLVKNAIIQIDATPFRQWYEQHYGVALGKKKKEVKKSERKSEKKSAKKKEDKEEGQKKDSKPEGEGAAPKEDAAKAQASDKKSHSVKYKLAKRRMGRTLEPALDEQFNAGRLYAAIASRPGQCGRCDGYILEGQELAFYLKKIHAKKKGKTA